MFGKMAKFIDKYGPAICAIITVLAVWVLTLCLNVNAKQSIEHQVETLYAKAELFTGDISSLPVMSGVITSVSDSEIRITYEEKDCKLVDVYDTNGKMLTRTFTDKRLGKSLGETCVLVFLVAIETAVVSFLLLLALMYLFERLQAKQTNKKRIKQQKQEASKDSNKHNKK